MAAMHPAHPESDLPTGLAAPARRALAARGLSFEDDA
jgi:hypothetical protein